MLASLTPADSPNRNGRRSSGGNVRFDMTETKTETEVKRNRTETVAFKLF